MGLHACADLHHESGGEHRKAAAATEPLSFAMPTYLPGTYALQTVNGNSLPAADPQAPLNPQFTYINGATFKISTPSDYSGNVLHVCRAGLPRTEQHFTYSRDIM